MEDGHHATTIHVNADAPRLHASVEAVWDAPFAEGGFDRTDRVFGSGVRVRGGAVTFVSSATTLDRLQWDGEHLHDVSKPLHWAVERAKARYHRDPAAALS